MFENLIESLIKQYIGGYLEKFDKSQFKTAIVDSNFSFEDIKPKTSPIDIFCFPFEILLERIFKLNIKIPWKDIFTKPTILEILDVQLVAGVLNQDEWKHLDLLSFEAKKSKVESVFNDQVSKLQEKLVKQLNDLFLDKVRNRIITNHKLDFKHFHLRLEDITYKFSLGVTNKNITVCSTDTNFQELKEESSSIIPLIQYKLAKVENLGVYLNINESNLIYNTKNGFVNNDNNLSTCLINKFISYEMNKFFNITQKFSSISDYLINPMNLAIKLILDNTNKVIDVSEDKSSIKSIFAKLHMKLIFDKFQISIEKKLYNLLINLSATMQAYQIFQSLFINTRIYYFSKPQLLQERRKYNRDKTLDTTNENKDYMLVWRWAIKTIITNNKNIIDNIDISNKSYYHLNSIIHPFKTLDQSVIIEYKRIYVTNITLFADNSFALIPAIEVQATKIKLEEKIKSGNNFFSNMFKSNQKIKKEAESTQLTDNEKLAIEILIFDLEKNIALESEFKLNKGCFCFIKDNIGSDNKDENSVLTTFKSKARGKSSNSKYEAKPNPIFNSEKLNIVSSELKGFYINNISVFNSKKTIEAKVVIMNNIEEQKSDNTEIGNLIFKYHRVDESIKSQDKTNFFINRIKFNYCFTVNYDNNIIILLKLYQEITKIKIKLKTNQILQGLALDKISTSEDTTKSCLHLEFLPIEIDLPINKINISKRTVDFLKFTINNIVFTDNSSFDISFSFKEFSLCSYFNNIPYYIQDKLDIAIDYNPNNASMYLLNITIPLININLYEADKIQSNHF